MVSAHEVKRKSLIVVEGQPYYVTEVFVAVPSARGASTMVRIKMKHLLQGTMIERSFKAAEKFEEPDSDMVEAHYLYCDGDFYYFMDQASFETLEIPSRILGDAAGYLQEQLPVRILKYQGAPASVELPPVVTMCVRETELSTQQPGSAGSGTKNATLESGKVVRVPQYITAGEMVRVSTETGDVLGRA